MAKIFKRVRCGWVLVGMVAMAAGCGGSDSKQAPDCEPGATDSCVCDDGSVGNRSCSEDGVWDDCSCTGSDGTGGTSTSAAGGAQAVGAGSGGVGGSGPGGETGTGAIGGTDPTGTGGATDGAGGSQSSGGSGTTTGGSGGASDGVGGDDGSGGAPGGASGTAGTGGDSVGAGGNAGAAGSVGAGGGTTGMGGLSGGAPGTGGSAGSGGSAAGAGGELAGTGGSVAGSAGEDSGTGGEDSGTGGDPGSGGVTVDPDDYPPAGNPDGNCAVPAEAQAENSSSPDHVVGTGTPGSCTGQAFIDAVALGGVITFDCGPDPVTIVLESPAKVFNDADPDIVIDGGGLVTLSGGGTSRILYMNTCDPDQNYTTDHCQDQDHPRLTVQNLTFINADSSTEPEYDGGGAIWVRGGRFKVVNSRFFNNVCADVGQDLGGAGIRVFSQYQGLPVYVVNSTFGGAEGLGNVCSNGGGISSIGVSWTIINSLFSYNSAIGNGGNPAEPGTPGGGSGGAIYNDGNTMTLTVCGTLIEHNTVNSYGSAIFFVSNDHSGNIVIDQSVIQNNVGGSWYPAVIGISMHDDTQITITDSITESP
jgi:hypothetical protein